MRTREGYPRGWVTTLVAGLAVAGLLSGCGNGAAGADSDAEAETPIPVEVTEIERGNILAVYSGTAAFEAEREAQVVAKVAGEVRELLAEEGDQVRSGQVLARLDGDRLRLELERARSRLGKLRNDYERNVELHAKGLVTKESFEALRFDMEALEADMALASLELSYTEIRAPIDGVIHDRQIKVGNTVSVNDPAFQITDLEPLVAYLHVPEREFNKLEAGQLAEIRVDALGPTRYSGRIARISPVVDSETGTFKVTIEANDKSGQLKPGMFARFNVVYDVHQNALLIPRSAIVDDQAERSVFIVEESVARRRSIRTGLANGPLIEVIEGLAGDERVVTVGQTGLRDGGKVQVVGEPETSAIVAAQAPNAG